MSPTPTATETFPRDTGSSLSADCSEEGDPLTAQSWLSTSKHPSTSAELLTSFRCPGGQRNRTKHRLRDVQGNAAAASCKLYKKLRQPNAGTRRPPPLPRGVLGGGSWHLKPLCRISGRAKVREPIS